MATNDVSHEVKRRNVIFALVHVALVLVILAAFVYVQGHK